MFSDFCCSYRVLGSAGFVYYYYYFFTEVREPSPRPPFVHPQQLSSLLHVTGTVSGQEAKLSANVS
jgi:hypothetical protein